jgi:hypothetical protein
MHLQEPDWCSGTVDVLSLGHTRFDPGTCWILDWIGSESDWIELDLLGLDGLDELVVIVSISPVAST